MMTRAWALTELMNRAVVQAIAGVGLCGLVQWLRGHAAWVGEQGRRKRKHQIPQLLALAHNPLPP
jgi:hypothetical protein